jgi:hypothetical protein
LIVEKFMWWERGDKVTDVLTTKLGIVFLRFDSEGEMLSVTERLPDLIRCQID